MEAALGGCVPVAVGDEVNSQFAPEVGNDVNVRVGPWLGGCVAVGEELDVVPPHGSALVE